MANGRYLLDETGAILTLESGHDADRGNLLGIQPWMTTADYVSRETFYDKLAEYLDVARSKGWLNARTVAVFPEYVGTWLVIAGEGQGVARASTLNRAMVRLALRHGVKFVRFLFSARERDRVAASLFGMQASRTASAYQAVFSRLARTYGVTVVAGSTVLPSPQVHDGCVVAGEGPLQGVSAVFGPDGRAYPDLVRKAYPIGTELPFLKPASPEDLPVFDTPAGRLGVLICADSWYPPPYARLKSQGVELLAVPSYVTHDGAWDTAWRGYDGFSAPADVDKGDIGKLTEGQAWRTYALEGRILESGARAGINVFLRGRLWDLGADGRSLMVATGREPVQAGSCGEALFNLWL